MATTQRRQKHKKFTGKFSKLSEKIKIPPRPQKIVTVLTSPDEEEQIEKEREEWKTKCAFIAGKNRFEKFDLLFDWYDIDKNDLNGRWFKLAFRLVLDHIRGFSVVEEKRSGRRKEWNDFRLLELNWEINKTLKQKKQRDPSYSAKAVCKYATDWGCKSGALYNRYLESKQSTFVKWFESMENNSNLSSKEINETLEEFIALTKGATCPM